MINSFNSYLKTGKARKKTPDPEEAKAFAEKAADRLELIKARRIDKKSAKFILEDSYEAIREAAQALMSIRGFKPYSHEATISFVKEYHKTSFTEEELGNFDYFRKLRNNSVYKAVEIEEEDAKSSLEFAEKIIKKIKALLKSKD